MTNVRSKEERTTSLWMTVSVPQFIISEGIGYKDYGGELWENEQEEDEYIGGNFKKKRKVEADNGINKFLFNMPQGPKKSVNSSFNISGSSSKSSSPKRSKPRKESKRSHGLDDGQV